MNPLDLPGPEFLLLFMVLILSALGGGFWIRHRFRLPADDPPPEALRLDPYEIAYLAGPEQPVQAAIARLVNDGYLTVDKSGKGLNPGERILTQASELERAVHETVKSAPMPDIPTLVARSQPALRLIRS